MNITECTNKLKKITKVHLDESMKLHTTFKIGGMADVFVMPQSEKELMEITELCRAENVPYMIIGNGSNLLVSDNGIEGVVISTEGLKDLYIENEIYLYSAAGNMLSKTANFAAESSLSGLEFASGIPGTCGGGVFMNAGAYDGELADSIVSVRVLADGEIKEILPKECNFGYRSSIFQHNNWVILGAKFKLKKGNKEEIKAKAAELNSRRREKQPLEYPSAGSTFKRPEGYFAGKLIEDAGLRGFCIGDAQVSEKHCGFVINRGNATAKDVIMLTEHIKKTVREKFGVELEEEIKITGKAEE